jgi:cellulose synthase/poly-beta-1,6-N-acetylglucosamine synthase-like glycosyltransferase
MLEIVFWTLVFVTGYVYFGYPALLFVLARGARHKRLYEESEPPPVTLLISAFNEEDCIADKLDNSLLLDYPKELLEIIVISDASDDRTDDIVRGYADRGIKLLRMEDRGGKTLGLNAGVEKAQGAVIVFSDANAMYLEDAVRSLVAPYADETIGAVIGESTYIEPDDDSGRSESLYWRYETAIKRYESEVGSVVGGDGAIYSVRKELFRPMSADALSDFVNPLQVVEQGRRCVYEPRAISVEEVAGSFEKEFKRKVRIVNRAWRAVWRLRGMLNPIRHGAFSLRLWSHKVLRWLVPFMLVGAFVLNLALVNQSPIYKATLLLQIIFYALAVVGFLNRGRDKQPAVLHVPFYFCLVNYASALGLIEGIFGKSYVTWTTARTD